MKKRHSPWSSRSAAAGAVAGTALAVGVWLLPVSRGATLRALAGVAVALLAYTSGVLRASRRQESEDARTLLELREELRLSQDHIMAGETYRSLGAYVEIASHQMKEPLQAVVGAAAAIASRPDLSSDLRKQVDALKAGADGLAGTLRHLAGYTLARPGRAPFSVNVLFREAILLCRRRAGEKNIVFEERYGDIPPVMGPAARIHQAILNIIVNAVEAMPFGGGTIVITTTHEGEHVTARVSDSGIGIRPEHQGRIFEPFFTTKPEKKSAGLGLWAARQMLDIIGADISVVSAPFKGTEVTLVFRQAAPIRAGREGTVHPPEIPRNTADDREIA
ncbi:MAG TPA: HAMP domain-containing sensor histidine kinase [Candidatus Polarisedimenticolia bacterium]|jgi:signal transduction histidine kinase|nr:HAMP domain-containing sensor histidine kinase [Candidatus Polarisedimenticolia bacterium]